MRIAIVNDSRTAVAAVRRVLLGTTRHQIAWVAVDGADAVARCAKDTPDLILMSLMEPAIDGLSAIRAIMAKTPCAILIVTANIQAESTKIFEALGAGALDVVRTPVVTSGSDVLGAGELIVKLDTIARAARKDTHRSHRKSERVTDAIADQRLVVIGASAGGPSAVATILRQLPTDFPAGIVIVQHIDGLFAPTMAKWLNGQSHLPVRIARDGEYPQERTVLMAGSNDHLALRPSRVLTYTAEPTATHYRPSIDVFFQSVRRHWTGPTVGVLLTGMGKDGAAGLKALRDAGALTLTQDRATSVVYGMPKAAAALNAASEILNLEQIAPRLIRHFGESNKLS